MSFILDNRFWIAIAISSLLHGCAHPRGLKSLSSRVEVADLIFIGTVEVLGPAPDPSRPAFPSLPSPGLVENRLIPIQAVTFKNVRVLKGNYSRESIEVEYVWSDRPPYVSKQGLNPYFFDKESRLIVFARQNVFGGPGGDDDIWKPGVRERHTEQYSKSLENAVRRLLQ